MITKKEAEKIENEIEQSIESVFNKPENKEIIDRIENKENLERLIRAGEDKLEVKFFGKPLSYIQEGFNDAFGDFVSYDIFTLIIYGYVASSFILYLINLIFLRDKSKCSIMDEFNARLF